MLQAQLMHIFLVPIHARSGHERQITNVTIEFKHFKKQASRVQSGQQLKPRNSVFFKFTRAALFQAKNVKQKARLWKHGIKHFQQNPLCYIGSR
jgi:hypothetical protein